MGQTSKTLIILDMDGTLYDLDGKGGKYQGSTLQKAVLGNAVGFLSTLSKQSEKDAKKEIDECLLSKRPLSGYFAKRYNLTRSEYFDIVWNIPPSGIVKHEHDFASIIKNLQKNGIHFVLITESPAVWQKQIFKFLKLERDWFIDIFTGEMFLAKGEVMQDITKKVKAEVVYSIGDQYETDIKPAEDLGYKTKEVKNSHETYQFMLELEKLLSLS
ncbi:hypothetical protein A2382_03705 [Candidatus Woesebacteria bacterium RIFOXYB1_FULL_38_16]|uniref:FCP1 homology domain-containing protein n=1 Tax=Candidatus Woesebacteria bacterium RIFOXYB1_FULL_38_16 TaxID=1802538 RepID=A0A1F8CT58_9BACT|nr:MAG: hypothetical protein A2382_03705 [Candidatus Woesebacteria bacterium RIFOXYB1_FULL_38_16]